MNLGSLQKNIKSIGNNSAIFGYKNIINGKYQNNKLKRLINLYQSQYRNGIAQGFGDYLRGSFFLLQIAMKNNLKFDMNFVNHPIGEFLEISQEQREEEIDFKNICRYLPNNVEKMHKEFYAEFSRHLNLINVPNYYLFCNSYPISHITNFQRRIILSKIRPTEELFSTIKNVEKQLNLSTTYGVIHIRTGDAFILQNKKIDMLSTLSILNQIKKYISPIRQYLLLSDNNELKEYLAKSIPNAKFIINDITHLGESKNPSSISVKNTLVDFFLMSKAKSIISFTINPHGTSFSEWCAKLYNIPYYCEMLNVAKKKWFSMLN
uniref:Uncharacterized protein n=1 Tax=viral metagenome TaxID=1070528 RepID=A0A6C0F5C2_9ZZZZ